MMNYIDLAQTTPFGEDCAQVGTDNYTHNAKLESKAYIAQLQRQFGLAPDGTHFLLRKCAHDAGTYIDIRLVYDDQNATHLKYMNQIEEGCETWDAKALEELQINHYNLPNIHIFRAA
jgi:hypothetical protein